MGPEDPGRETVKVLDRHQFPEVARPHVGPQPLTDVVAGAIGECRHQHLAWRQDMAVLYQAGYPQRERFGLPAPRRRENEKPEFASIADRHLADGRLYHAEVAAIDVSSAVIGVSRVAASASSTSATTMADRNLYFFLRQKPAMSDRL